MNKRLQLISLKILQHERQLGNLFVGPNGNIRLTSHPVDNDLEVGAVEIIQIVEECLSSQHLNIIGLPTESLEVGIITRTVHDLEDSLRVTIHCDTMVIYIYDF